MTSYGEYSPYVAPSSLEEWLEKKGIAPTFATVFTWSTADVFTTYEEYNNNLKIIIGLIEERTAEFDALHESRIAYMVMHGIDNWPQLDPVQDVEHLAIKNSLFSSIEISVTESKRLKKERTGIEATIPLLAGVLVDTYTSFSSIINQERNNYRKPSGMRHSNNKMKINKFKLRDLKNPLLGAQNLNQTMMQNKLI